MPSDDPLAALLAPELAEALDFALLLAYAAGWNDANSDEPLTIADARLAERIEGAGVTWQARVTAVGVPRAVPEWLQRLQAEKE